jgi:pyruvate dehydrogenase E2 component (dihydrolipoamide acetyltransferase)
MIEFKLPSLGADMEEGKLLEWKVKPGDVVKRGDVIVVVDTTKAAVDVESWEEGTMHEQLVPVGATVPVGTVIATLLAPGESAPARTGDRPPVPFAGTGGLSPVSARKPVSPAARARAKELAVNVEKVTGTGPQGAVTVEDVEKAARIAVPEDRASGMRRAIGAAMARSKREIPHYYLSRWPVRPHGSPARTRSAPSPSGC